MAGNFTITIPTLAWVIPLLVVVLVGYFYVGARWLLPWFDRNVNDRLIERTRRKRAEKARR